MTQAQFKKRFFYPVRNWRLFKQVLWFCIWTPYLFAENFVIQNSSFEITQNQTLAHWRWWSRNQQGGATQSDTEAILGKYSAQISHEGPRDWAFSSRSAFQVQAGEYYQISAQVKVEQGGISLAAVGQQGKEVLYWDIGSTRMGPSTQWKHISAVVEIPDDCDRLYLRFMGNGNVSAWVDEVKLKAIAAPKPPPAKAKVELPTPTRLPEKMDRALIAFQRDDGSVYLGWRLLAEDPDHISFNLYRQSPEGTWNKLNHKPITQTTDFIDSSPLSQVTNHYRVLPVINGIEKPNQAASAILHKDSPYLKIPLNSDSKFQKVGIADLDGDGRYDFVIKTPAENIDPYANYWKPSPDTYALEAYNADGTFLWRYDLGWAIERGIWYSPYIVYDFNGDGFAEVAVKAGEGDPRAPTGRVTQGPEHLSILDGRSGQLIAQTTWPSRILFNQTTSPYNYASRNQLGLAYLDGKTPCLMVARGTYNLMVLEAYTLQDTKLKKLWTWSNVGLPRRFQGQGAHGMHVADVDGDGRDEVVLGSVVIDDNGDALWSTGLGHPDHVYLGELDPSHPGLEIYYGLETHQPKNNGMGMVDAATGTFLWGFQGPTRHIHSQGMGSDIDPNYEGVEFYSVDTDANKKPDRGFLWSSQGELIQTGIPWRFGPNTVYWDADPQREILWKGEIRSFDAETHSPQIKGKVIAIADLYGDWREEIITSVKGEMRIYTSTLPARDRRVCLMSDPIYRIDVAHTAMGYFQVPMLSFDLTQSTTRSNLNTK